MRVHCLQQIRQALLGHTHQQHTSRTSDAADEGDVEGVCKEAHRATTPEAAAPVSTQCSLADVSPVRIPYDGSLLGAAAMGKVAASLDAEAAQGATGVETTPRDSGVDLTADSSILSPGTRAGRSNLAHEKNVALAREIDTMRQRLQAMGMCGGALGAQAPTPALSAAPSLTPSVQASPAKPRATRTFNSMQRQRETARPPVFSLTNGGDDAKPAAQAEDANVSSDDPGAKESARKGDDTNRQLAAESSGLVDVEHAINMEKASPSGDEGEGPCGAPTVEETQSAMRPPQQQRSLFDKMRSAGAVIAHQRADCGKASCVKTVYQALEDEPAPSLAGDTILSTLSSALAESLRHVSALPLYTPPPASSPSAPWFPLLLARARAALCASLVEIMAPS